MLKNFISWLMLMAIISFGAGAAITDCYINEAGQIIGEENCGISGHCN